MSVIGGILLFVSGVAVGGGAVVYNYTSIKRVTAAMQREIEDLKTASWQDAITYERDRAYRQGYKKGRKSPMSDVEEFADFLEDHNIDFRPQRRRSERNGQESDG